MAISMGRAKALCSASELALMKASTRQEIGGHTAARLRQKETQARKLRDKWRDLAASQKRSTQAKVGSRDADYNKNSAEKAELFDEVLSRFSAQLAKQEAAGETPGPMGRRRSTKTARSRTHRAARADVRGELAEAKRELKAKAKKKAAAPAKKSKPVAAAAAEIVEAAEPTAAVTAPAAEPKKPSKRPRPVVGVHATAIEAGRKAQGLRVTKQTQLAARTAAKQDRLKASGLMRIQKNRSAANKRSQGRRDSR
ncbi:MAG: hypothetical protein AB7G28_19990 [Pirellulales bacterium]